MQQASYHSVSGILGRNVIVARCAAGLTQLELASRALVSRATIVQIESGSADPKISTVQQIARALGVTAALLLVGVEEVRGTACLLKPGEGDEISGHLHAIGSEIEGLLHTGRLRELGQAARLTSRTLQESGTELGTAVRATIGAIILPMEGARITADWREQSQSPVGTVEMSARVGALR